MERFDSVLIASDIDGTLIDKGGIVPRNRARIADFVARGGAFCLATGRNHLDIAHVMPDVSEFANAPCILCNGSYLYDVQKDEILHPSYLPFDDAYRLLLDMRAHFPNVGFRGTYEKGFLVSRYDEIVREQFRRWGIDFMATYCEDEAFTRVPLFKAVCIGAPEALAEVHTYLLGQGYGALSMTRSSPNILEILPKGISKGHQIAFLRQLYPNRTIYAVGDYDNDKEMLQAADVAACPENALDSVKELCDLRLCACRDGAIGDLIDRIEEN